MYRNLILSLVAATSLCATHAVTISNYDDWNGVEQGFLWGNTTSLNGASGLTVIGQTFATPDSGSTVLNEFSFWIRNALGNDKAGSTFMHYDFVLALWDNTISKPTHEVYRSEKRTWTSTPVGDNELPEVVAITESAIGASLDPSLFYVALLDATPYIGETDELLNLMILIPHSSSYANGGIALSNTTNPADVIDGVTFQNGVNIYDFVFEAKFSVPSHENTLPLLGLSLGGLLLVYRSRGKRHS